MIQKGICACLLLLMTGLTAVNAQPADRTLWYEAKATSEPNSLQTFKVPSSNWWRLRVYSNGKTAQQLSPTLWSSTGGGIFISHRPIEVQHRASYSEYFYAANATEDRILLLRSSEERNIRLFHSHTKFAPDLHDDAHIKLSEQHSSTTLTMRSGYEAHDMQWVAADKNYVTKFNEPGLYHLEIRVPWQDAYGLFETLTLHGHNRQLQLTAQLDNSTYYEEESGRTLLLSRALRVPFYVAEAKQQITLDLDHDVYLRWLQSDPSEQFLFNRNAPSAIESARDKQLALTAQLWPTTSFFRSLPPQQTLPTTSFIPLTGAARKKTQRVLPSPAIPTRKPEYFYELSTGQSANFDLPEQTRHAPVKLSIKWQEAPTSLTVHTDSGEQREILIRPDIISSQEWQLDDSSELALMSNTTLATHKVTEVLLDFYQPYQSLRVTTTGKNSTWFRLEYKNERPASPSDPSWRDLSQNASTALLTALRSGPGTESIDDLSINNQLKNEVITQWHSRLKTRALQFSERHASHYLTTAKSITPVEFEKVRNELAKTFNVQLTDVADVYQQLIRLGYNFTARQLLVDLAVGTDARFQAQAEALLLELFTEQERWFDTEGYWAWRLFHRSDIEAFEAIALSWTKQYRHREAAQLFMLLEKSQLTEVSIDKALRSALLSEQPSLAEHWFSQLSYNEKFSWPGDVNYHWTRQRPTFIGNTREALIYNVDFDLYLTTLYVEKDTPLHMQVADSPRLKVTIYPDLTEEVTSHELNQLSVTIDDKVYSLAARMDRASESLRWAQNRNSVVGLPQSFTFEINTAQSNDISIATHGFAAGLVVETATPELLSAKATRSVDNASLPPAIDPLTQRLSTLALQHQQSALSDEQRKQLKAEMISTPLTKTQELLLDRLNQGYAWQKLDTVSSSDGIAYLESEYWQPSAPWWQVRKALMTSDGKLGERRLANGESVQLAVNLRVPKKVNLEVRKANELGGPVAHAVITINTPDGTKVKELTNGLVSIPLSLEAGAHTITLELTKSSNALVLYRLIDDQGTSLLPNNQVKTFRAAQGKDIELFVPANNLLRIDHYSSNEAVASHRYKWFPKDTYYKVPHRGDQADYSYYRFFIWQQQPLMNESEALVVATEQEPLFVNTSPTIWPIEPQRAVFADTLYKLGEQDAGSWGVALGYNARNNFDEDLSTEQEEFIESQWNYRRQLEDLDAYWHSSLQWRAHTHTQLDTLVSDNDFYWIPNKYFDAQARLNFYYQAGAAENELRGAWSTIGSLSGRWKYYWNNRTRNELEVLAYARHLSESTKPAGPIDDDIVTQYKLDHRYGLSVRDQITYQPWLDARAHVEGKLTFNEVGDSQLLDHWSVTGGWRQYFKPWRLGLDARYSQYLRDDNRPRRLSSTQLALSIDYEWWQAMGNLWQFSFDIRHDINRSNTSAFIGISWNHTAGQGYDDFAPPTLLFAPLRQRHALEKIETNEITINDPLEAVDEN